MRHIANLGRRLARKFTILLDSVRGLDFEAAMLAEEAGLDPELSHRSTPSGNRYLNAVLDTLSVSPRHGILDLGCGKGSAMRLMGKYPFQRIAGIELSEKVASIARRNFARLGDPRYEVVCMDAAQFTDYHLYSHLYLYNPFPRFIMEMVLEKIAHSIKEDGARLVIIYCNPVCHDTILKTGMFAQTGDYPAEWENRTFVYEQLSKC